MSAKQIFKNIIKQQKQLPSKAAKLQQDLANLIKDIKASQKNLSKLSEKAFKNATNQQAFKPKSNPSKPARKQSNAKKASAKSTSQNKGKNDQRQTISIPETIES